MPNIIETCGAEGRPARMLFVNLAVRDLERSKRFFAALGFGFNPQFTDANAACLL